MKILQVVPELNSGGVEAVTLGLANYLAQQGHESLVLSNGGRSVAELEAGGSRHLTLPVHKKSLLSLRLLAPLKRLLLLEQPDILHLRSRAPAWLCYLAWKQLPIEKRPKLVTTVHGFYSVNRYSAVMTKGEKVICVSQSVADYVRANYPATESARLQIIHEGVDPTQYHAEFKPNESWVENWFQEFPQTRHKTLLILPGRITRLKGHRDFLELIGELSRENPSIHGLIVGGAHPRKRDYLAELKEEVAARGLADAITFTGRRDDLREILALGDLSFSLSTQPESFGLTVLEALSLGKPVIGYPDGGVGELLSALFPTGAIARENGAALLQKTREILSHSPEVSPNHQFLSERVHSHTLALYTDLAKEHDSLQQDHN